MQAALLACLLSLAPTTTEREIARQYRLAFRSNDSGAQQALAARPALQVQYTVVVHLLLQLRECGARRPNPCENHET